MNNKQYKDSKNTSLAHNQQGVALLTILILVVIVTMLATTMIAKQNRMVRETGVMLRQDIIQAAALAGEKNAIALLKKDVTVNKSDSLQDIWAKKLEPITFSGAKVTFEIVEYSGKFNINNLHYKGKVAIAEKKFFERLLKQLGLDSTLVNPIIDWQDADSNPNGESGAEQDFYSADGVVVANQDFYNINEVNKVKGVNAKVFQTLQPYTIAVPVYTTININTADSAIFAALAPKLNTKAIVQWKKSRKDSVPFVKVSQLFSAGPFSSIKPKDRKLLEPLLSVESQLFKIKTHVKYDGKTKTIMSYVFKYNGEFTVFRRDFSAIASVPSTSKK